MMDQIRENFQCKTEICLGNKGGSTPAFRAGDPGLNPGPWEDFSLNFNKMSIGD